MRGAKDWVYYVVGFLAVQLVFAYLFLATALQENCDNGIFRWQCNGSIAGVAAVGAISIPVIGIVGAVILYRLPRR